MHYWLIKSEPGTYSWDDLVRDTQTRWDGVRNFQARNNIRAVMAFPVNGSRSRPCAAVFAPERCA